MLSVERMRQIDPAFSDLSDSEVEEIRAALYESAQLAFDVYWTRKYGSKYPLGSFPSDTTAVPYTHD